MNQDICALATANGIGAIGIIRISGNDALSIVQKSFKGKDLSQQKSHTVHYGYFMDEIEVIDEVMLSIFLAPKSFTTENSVRFPFTVHHILVKKF
jgi:tRNA modification GTPase